MYFSAAATNRNHIMGSLAAFELVNRSVAQPELAAIVAGFDLDYETIESLAGPIVLDRVSFDDGRFDYDAYGPAAILLTVRDLDAERDIDVLAISLINGQYGTRLRRAGLLGSHNTRGGFVQLWSHPWDWLAAGCNGTAILDLELAIPILEAAPGPFGLQDITLADWLCETVLANKLFIKRQRAA